MSHPPAGAEVVIGFGGFFARYDGDLALDRLAFEERGGEGADFFFRDVVLWASLAHAPAGIEEHDLVLARRGLTLRQHDDEAGGAGVVEEVVRQEDDAVNQVAVDELTCPPKPGPG